MLRIRNSRGRPKKFGRPARSVTLTLPHDVIERLGSMNTDLARAIVSLVDRAPGKDKRHKLAEVVSYGKRSVVLVTPVRAFKRVPGMHLVPVSNGQALMALEQPHAIAELELNLRDVADNSDVTPREREVLQSVAEILKDARLNHSLTVAERSIIVFEGRRRHAE